MFRGILLVLAAAALTTAALTGCASEEAPAPTASAASTIPAPPQVTTTPDGRYSSGASTAARASSSSAPNADDPATNTPVDPAAFAVPDNQVAWKSPSGKIYCKIGTGQFSSGCQSSDAPVPDGAGEDCAPNTTFTVDMLSKGFYLEPQSVRPTCFNQGVFGAENAQVLEYNTSITFNGFTCFSRTEGMICDAGGGHGFVLSMQQATSN